jgi:hypothetical protein
MQYVTLEIEQGNDLQLLLLLAERIGLKIISSKRAPIGMKDREKHLRIIAKGGDTSYIPNPVEWQREVREDRKLPYRD